MLIFLNQVIMFSEKIELNIKLPLNHLVGLQSL